MDRSPKAICTRSSKAPFFQNSSKFGVLAWRQKTDSMRHTRSTTTSERRKLSVYSFTLSAWGRPPKLSRDMSTTEQAHGGHRTLSPIGAPAVRPSRPAGIFDLIRIPDLIGGEERSSGCGLRFVPCLSTGAGPGPAQVSRILGRVPFQGRSAGFVASPGVWLLRHIRLSSEPATTRRD